MSDTATHEPLHTSIVRLADAIGTLKPSSWTKQKPELDRIRFELPSIPGMDMHTLTALLALPEANEVISAKCNHCEETVECRRIVAPFVACDACIKKHGEDVALERNREYWERVCPERFRSTDTKHKDFPQAVYKELRAADPKKSLFLYGPTGTCKTRVGMLLLKHALLRGSRVGVLWPEKLSGLKSDFDEKGTFEHYAGFELLLIDDALLTAVRSSRLIDALKQLIDVRMRHDRAFIFTSQIGTEEDLKEGKEFGEAKTADVERIKALLRRLREECAVVPFAMAKPKDGETAF